MSQWRQTAAISVVTLLVSGLSIAKLNTLLPEKDKNVSAFSFITIPEQDSQKTAPTTIARIPRSSTPDAIAPGASRTRLITPRQTQPKPSLQATNNNTWLAASFPVENFKAYTSAFGYRPSATGGSRWEFHSGLDIAAPQGSYIRNWWAGRVSKVGDRNACGTHVVIESGPWEHTYCHMEGHVESASGRRYLIDRNGGIQLWEGQSVPAGFRIGRVGMTGRTTGPHLHWGLKYAKNYVDPAVVLRAMFSQQQIARASSQKWTPQQSQVIIEESKSHQDNY
jgi:murein DD-endopeptidase MepM/ murein hydrolase activator NlpD